MGAVALPVEVERPLGALADGDQRLEVGENRSAMSSTVTEEGATAFPSRVLTRSFSRSARTSLSVNPSGCLSERMKPMVL